MFSAEAAYTQPPKLIYVPDVPCPRNSPGPGTVWARDMPGRQIYPDPAIYG